MKKLWKRWKLVASKIGDLQFTILFSILYILLVTPVGMISRRFNDYLQRNGKSSWTEIENSTSTLDKMRKQ